MPEPAVESAIRAEAITHRYSGVLAVEDVSLAIAAGSFSAVLGANGAGKSTLAQILTGLIKPTAGTIRYAGVDPARVRPGEGLIRSRICLVPEGRRLFGGLTIEENLVLGGYGVGLSRPDTRRRMQDAIAILPAGLRDGMRHRVAGTLSGGERQMLALARALMADPKVIVIDEPSMGLAPLLIDKVYEVLGELNRRGVTVVVVEQQAAHALRHAGAIHVMERSRLIYSGPSTGRAAEQALQAGYVGECS